MKANEYAAKECSRIIGWFGSYSDASETAAEKGYKKFSIQHSGQGWQDHKWCLIHYFKGV